MERKASKMIIRLAWPDNLGAAFPVATRSKTTPQKYQKAQQNKNCKAKK